MCRGRWRADGSNLDSFPPIEIDTDDFVREVTATGSDAEVVVLDGEESFTLD